MQTVENADIMGKKVADQLVETICRAGIRHIYAVTGDSLNEVNDAVRRAGTVRWVHVRHEESGAFAAAAESELNGIACCAGSSGPGHVHLINGLYDAHRSNCPVLAIASTCPSDQFGTGYFQETDPPFRRLQRLQPDGRYSRAVRADASGGFAACDSPA